MLHFFRDLSLKPVHVWFIHYIFVFQLDLLFYFWYKKSCKIFLCPASMNFCDKLNKPYLGGNFRLGHWKRLLQCLQFFQYFLQVRGKCCQSRTWRLYNTNSEKILVYQGGKLCTFRKKSGKNTGLSWDHVQTFWVHV